LGRLITITVTLFVFITNAISHAQTNVFDSMPQEKISITTNATIFVTGENLLYKLDCFANDKHSSLSKIAYVLLINDAKKIIFKQKIKLDDGRGYADYYIPTSLKTGNYKLCGFTNWMKNNKKQKFSCVDISIVNPYLKNKEEGLNTKTDSLTFSESLQLKEITQLEGLKISANANRFKTRNKVIISLTNANPNSKNGSYSLSVRKVDSVALIKQQKQEDKIKITKNTEFSLPELRGEIISGKIISKVTGAGIPNKIVALSIMGNRNIYKTSKTNSKGVFYFSVSKNYNSGKLIIQIVDDDYSDFEVVLNQQNFEFQDALNINNLVLNKNIANWLLSKSLNNQIETAFYNSKKDSLLNGFSDEKFYDKVDLEFVLDDYKRFRTIKETFVEVIEGAGIETHKGKQEVVVYTAETIFDTQLPNLKTLLIVDGIPVFNHEIFINMRAADIKKISLIKKTFFHGASIFKNILIAETVKGDFKLPSKEVIFNKDISSFAKKKVYYRPDYEKDAKVLQRIPDYRTQLFWEPNLQLSDNLNIEFFTSDVKGVYEILIRGFDDANKSIVLKKYIVVD
jgi:hypothetical protein